MYSLEILSGDSPLRNVHIEDMLIVIGSLPDADIQLEGDDIAEKHLALEMKEGRMHIYDLAKSDRLLLNGRITRDAEVEDGSIIELGVFRLKVLLDHARDPSLLEPMGKQRPMGPLQWGSLGVVVLMLTVQLSFIFFVSLRWRGSEIREAAVPRIHLAQGTPPAAIPAVENPPPPEKAAPEEIKPAVPKPAPVEAEPQKPPQLPVVAPAVPRSEPVPPPTPRPAAPNLAVPKPAVPEPAVPEPVKPPSEVRGPAPEKPREPVAAPVKPAEPVPMPPRVTPPLVVPALPAPTPPPDPRAREKSMLEDARGLMKTRDWNGADGVLARLQQLNPDFTEAYVERARVFEARGLVKEAVDQWRAVTDKGPRNPNFSVAVRERDRLTKKIEEAETPPPPVKRAVPVEPSQRRISIADVEIQRYDKNERFDEMRLLTVVLKPRSASQRLAGPDITVEVAFFDQDVKSGRIEATRALVPESLFQLSGRIRLSEPPNLNVAYVVPKGFRNKQEQQLNREMRFYGYLIQLYYKGVLQHQVSKPESLIAAGPVTP